MGCNLIKTKKSIEVHAPKRLKSREISITPGTFLRMSHSNNYSDYTELEKLGSGAFADVVLCLHKPTNTHRAVKLIHKAGLAKSQKDPIYMLKEIQILKNLDHPNILKCFEIFEDELKYYVSTEYCPAGDLFGEICKLKKFTEAQASNIMFQLLSALIYCHDKCIIHRDLKPENILLMEKGDSLSIKVADFGSSCILDPECKLSGCFGSAYYLAPEVFSNNYNEKCDIWSLGIIMYILLTGRPPYPGKESKVIMKSVKETPFIITPYKVVGVTSVAVDLMKKLLIIDANERISAREAILHPWIQTYRDASDPGIDLLLNNLKDFNCQYKLKEAVHIFLASQVVTHEEIKNVKKAFQKLDIDGDGKITREELIGEYRKFMKIEDAGVLADQIIGKLDQDKDGNINFTEFLVSCNQNQKHLSYENLMIAFEMFDVDGSGTITADEIRNVLENGQLTEDNAWKELLLEADTNGDGCIDFKEFAAMMNSMNAIGDNKNI